MATIENMKAIGPAAKRRRKELRLTLQDVIAGVEALGVSWDLSNLSRFEKGNQSPEGDEKLNALATVLRTSVSALAKMAEEMSGPETGSYPTITPQTNPKAREPAAAYPSGSQKKLSGSSKVPVYTDKQLAQSQGSALRIEQDEAGEFVRTLTDFMAPGEFAWLMPDDSMTAPPGQEETYPKGHYVHFNPSAIHKAGDCVLLLLGPDTVTFTKLDQVAGVWTMIPLNQRYQGRELPMNARILAVAIGSQRVNAAYAAQATR